jgi:hypothetical protein
MAGRTSGFFGCLFGGATVLTGLIAGPALFSSPTFIGYLLLANPQEVVDNAGYAVGVLAATVLLAVALVAVTGTENTVAQVLRRATVLLLGTTATCAFTYRSELRGNYSPNLHLSVAPLFAAAGAAIVLLGYWMILDGRSTRGSTNWATEPGPRPPQRAGHGNRRPPNRRRRDDRRKRRPAQPVTVEQVREVTEQAKQSLSRVRAGNDRLERLLREFEAKLARAQLELGFEGLRQLHRESRGCADQVFRHYDSSDRMLSRISSTHHGVLAALQGTRAPSRRTYASARSEMSTTEGLLRAKVRRGRTMLKSLNQRTEGLKYRIRDECGELGQQWYDELIARRDAARAAEGR